MDSLIHLDSMITVHFLRMAILDIFLRPHREISIVKELRKQHEIAEIHDERPGDILVRRIALSSRVQLEKRVNVDGASDHHLEELHERDGDVHLAGYFDEARCSQSVVAVHDGVYGEVGDDEIASWSDLITIRVPSVEEYGDVMIPVQKHQLLFSKYNENGVAQLGDLAQDEEPCPKPDTAVEDGCIANRAMPAVVGQVVDELANGDHRTGDAEDGQAARPGGESPAEFELGPILHPCPPHEDPDEVDG